MEALYERLSQNAECLINCFDANCLTKLTSWHYHPETEIICIDKGNGSRFVGDHCGLFEEGDVVLVGSNLAHMWRPDAIYNENKKDFSIRALGVHFHNSILKGSMADLPEMEAVNKLLVQSICGVKFCGHARAKIATHINKIVVAKGVKKLTKLIKLLDFMATTEEKEILASVGYAQVDEPANYERFEKANRFMLENFQKNIDLETISTLIGMTPTSFCRYFKKHTKKSFNTVLNEIRIGNACKLLIDNRMSISGICYESGFSNISSFNQQFKKIKGVTPSEYLRLRKKPSLIAGI